MLRQTVVLTSMLFAVWGMGVAVLALNSDASADMESAMSHAQNLRYLVNTRTSLIYQDPTGRFTVYVRTALRDQIDESELKRY